jgi:small GTP-binding protein
MSDPLFKVVIVGSFTAGKTNVMKRYTENAFPATHATLLDFAIKTVHVDGHDVTLQIWDTLGGPWHVIEKNSKPWSLFDKVKGIIIVYDITRRATFNEAAESLLKVKERVGASTPIVLLGAKCDLEDHRQVYIEEGDTFARLHGVYFTEVSAKEDVNVTRVFDLLVELMLEHQCAEPPSTVSVTPVSAVSAAAGKRSPLASVRAMFARK